MKLKKFIMSLIAIIIGISCTSIVNAAEVSAKLIPSSTTVKKGETFTVTLSAECSDGINGVTTSMQYDEEVLELVNGAVSNTTNWTNYSISEGYENIEILSNSRTSITSDNIYIFTFKAKDNAKIGNTIISAGDIKIDSNASSNSWHTIDAESITINVTETGAINIGNQFTLTEIKIATPPTKTVYEAGEKFSPSGMVIKAVYSDGTEKTITDYAYSPSGNLTTSATKITITYTENGVTKTTTQNITINTSNINKDGEIGNNTTNNIINNVVENKDNTKTNNSIVNTGLEDNMGIIFVGIAIIGVASYIQYKKYKNF